MKNGHTSQFITLIREHEKIIHKVIGLYMDNDEDRRDCYQEIMVQAWKAFPRFEGRSKFSTYLYKICLNTCLSLVRKKSPPKDYNIQLESLIAEEEKPKNELLYLIVKQLNDVDKMLITLHLDSYSISEIVEITGMNKNKINVRLHRIKKHIIESYKIHANGTL